MRPTSPGDPVARADGCKWTREANIGFDDGSWGAVGAQWCVFRVAVSGRSCTLCGARRRDLRGWRASDLVACRDERRTRVAFCHDSLHKKTARRIRIAAFSFVERCSAAATPDWRELHSSARVDPGKDHHPAAQATGPHAGLLAFRITQPRFREVAGVCRTGTQGSDRSDPSGRTFDGSGASMSGGQGDLAESGRTGPESIRTRTHDARDICCARYRQRVIRRVLAVSRHSLGTPADSRPPDSAATAQSRCSCTPASEHGERAAVHTGVASRVPGRWCSAGGTMRAARGIEASCGPCYGAWRSLRGLLDS